jgi:4-alpha-glucanotransferase
MKLARSSGILLHPTSLPGSHGSGDFGASAYHFVDWLVKAGQTLWQILPLGGIGPGNSPYMSSSAFAGNLLLIDLNELVERGWLDAADVAPDATTIAAFSDERLNFSAVVPWRMAKLKLAAKRFAAMASAHEKADLAQFEASQSDWLPDYALTPTTSFTNRPRPIRTASRFLDILPVVLFQAMAQAQNLRESKRCKHRWRCTHFYCLPKR